MIMEFKILLVLFGLLVIIIGGIVTWLMNAKI